MRQEIDPVVFTLVKPHIEISTDHIEKTTPEALQAFRAYLANPSEDITGLRLMTLIDRANSLKRAYGEIESLLKRLEGEETKAL